MVDRAFAVAGDEVYVNETRILMQACCKRILEHFDKCFAALEASDLSWIAFLDPRVARTMNHLTTTTSSNACADIVRSSMEIAQQLDTLEADVSPAGVVHRSPDLVAHDDFDVTADIFGAD
jgi:hypothetical protein